uniref:Uncharacterized protein n=1 Tax=Eutreptiella gymnastica TaxID=73025 RepID=A0A7S1NQ59_9EUGL|mmetsp:Transcript_63821/g.113969  ORF Transcript_63821/g.113969 Transcript_63821/m.113969 type:complete len:247 (+) Transcript_63821:51-791(+)
MKLHLNWADTATSVLISGGTFFVADFCTQHLEYLYHKKRKHAKEDDKTMDVEAEHETETALHLVCASPWIWRRSMNFAFSGVISGLYQDIWCQVLDILLPGMGFKNAVLKTLVDCALNVVYIGMVLVINASMSGASVLRTLKDRFWRLYAAYLCVDVPVDLVVFAVVPVKWQGLTQNIIELFISMMMSHCTYQGMVQEAQTPSSVNEHLPTKTEASGADSTAGPDADVNPPVPGQDEKDSEVSETK